MHMREVRRPPMNHDVAPFNKIFQGFTGIQDSFLSEKILFMMKRYRLYAESTINSLNWDLNLLDYIETRHFMILLILILKVFCYDRILINAFNVNGVTGDFMYVLE